MSTRLAERRRLMPSVTERCVCSHFVMTSFFLVDGCAYSQAFCRFFGVATVNMFSSVNQNDANISGWIFLRNCFQWLSLAWEYASLSSGTQRFLRTNISQSSVATCLTCGEIYNYSFARILLLSLLVAKEAKAECHLFSGHSVCTHARTHAHVYVLQIHTCIIHCLTKISVLYLAITLKHDSILIIFGRNVTAKRCFIFPPRLSSVLAIPGKQKTINCVFHLNAACCFANTKHINNITWSQLNHPSLSKWLTICTRQDPGREQSILEYWILPSCSTFTKSVIASVAESKRELFFIKPGLKVNEQYCWDILLCQQMLDAIKCVVNGNFVF